MVATARAGLVPPFKPDVIGMDGAPAEVIAWAVDRMRPMPVAVLEQPLRLTGAGASLPHTYVWCTQSGYGRVAARARADGWDYRELDSPHCAMLVVPEQLTDLLLSL